MTARRDLLEQLDLHRRRMDQTVEMRNWRSHHERAFSLLMSEKTRKAFDLSSESSKTRAEYGLTEFGHRCLLARRLVEAGVPMVNVSYCHTPDGSWDTHGQHFKKMRESLAPTFDTAFSALVGDLSRRGMLDETLVLVNSEFGRTPTINSNSGRDHWPFVYSLALAGAGIKSGTVYGQSDNSAAYPTDRPHDPRDMAATIYHLLGVDPNTTVHDQAGRPHSLVIGKPIDGILA